MHVADLANLRLSQLTQFNPQTGTIAGAAPLPRYLSDLQGVFADEAAYQAALAHGNPLIYSVTGIEPAHGEGDLHYGLGVLMPGRIGAEYYMTKGHLHRWRPAAEVYIGLSGEGMLLLEAEANGECSTVPLRPNSAVYVPGATAHRTINTGTTPLTYLGVYPAAAGHDYETIARRNFRHVVAAVKGQPTLLERAAFLARLEHSA
jgi:glucose-6-phosphate isomerase